MSTIDLFPIKIYKTTYDKTEELKNTLFPKLEEIFKESESKNQEFMRDGTICSYNTAPFIHQQFKEETKDVVEFVQNIARDYWAKVNYYPGLTPFVAQMWANKTYKGGWVDSHLHGSIPFTCVMYIDASPEQGNIVLENPLDMVLSAQPVNYSEKFAFAEEIPVNTGDLLLFPGYLKHRVLQNTIDKPRLILGFNIGCTGQYWSSNWTSQFPAAN